MSHFDRNRSKILVHLILVLTIILIINSETANAQISSDKTIKIYGVDVSNLSEAKAFVFVVQARRVRPLEEFIMGLSPLKLNVDTFEVYVDGEQISNIQAEVFDASPEGIDVVLAVDVSGSVDRYFDRVRNAINTYINKLREGKDQIAILTFGSDIQVPVFGESAFTDDVNQLKQVIEKKPSRERMLNTLLFKAIVKAIQLAAQGRLEQRSRIVEKAVIVLSDGHDEGTGFTLEDCVQEANIRQIPVFALAVPEEKEKNKYHGNLEKIASATGGVFVPVNDMNKLYAVYEKLDELVKNQYVLNFGLPSRFADGKEHNLEVSATHEGVVVSTKATFQSGFTQYREPPPEPITSEQLEQIRGLQKEQKWKDIKLNKFVEEKFGAGRTVETLSTAEADNLIKSLKEIPTKKDGILTSWWVWPIGLVLVVAIVLVYVAWKRIHQS